MTEFELYHLPGACSRVTMTALEQCGVDYGDHPVNLAKGEQRSPEFLAVNPRGKIPALTVDGQLIGENAAIQWWLNKAFPAAGLFPKPENDWEEAQILSDLFWVSSGWHPSVRANMMPVRWTTGVSSTPRRESETWLSSSVPVAAFQRASANCPLKRLNAPSPHSA